MFKKTRIYTNFNLKNLIQLLQTFFFKKKDFEENIKKYLSTNNISLTSQGRVALFDIVKIIISNTGKRNFYISPFTIPEVIFAIKYAGGNVKYIDIDIETGLINEETLLSEIDDNSAAVIITHLYSNKNSINNFFKKIGGRILIIEDAAINFGASIDKKFLGTLGDFGFFSFNLVKNLNTLNGGAIYIKDSNIFNNYISKRKVKNFPFKETIKLLITVLVIKVFFNNISYQFFHYFLKHIYKNKINFFLKKIYPILYHEYKSHIPKNYFYDFNWLMNEVGKDNLRKVDEEFKNRLDKAKLYEKYINNSSSKKIIFDSKENVFLEYPIILKKINNLDLHNKLMEKGYDIRKIWYINNVKNEKSYDHAKFKDTFDLEKKIFCLPLHKNIDENDIKNISKIINEA